MPLQFTAAHSSRITKSSKSNRLPKRQTRPFTPSSSSSSTSIFSNHARKKPRTSSSSSRKKSSTTGKNDKDDEDEEEHHDPLPYLRPVSSCLVLNPQLAVPGTASSTTINPPLPGESFGKDITRAISNILSIKFTPIPPRRTGLSSTRVAEILNFRASLPPIVSVAHLHAVMGRSKSGSTLSSSLSSSSTQTERLISSALRSGKLRRISIPVREGAGTMAGVGDGLVLWRDWQDRVRSDGRLNASGGELTERYLSNMSTRSRMAVGEEEEKEKGKEKEGLSEIRPSLSTEDVQTLLRAGYLTSSSSTPQTSAHLTSVQRPAIDIVKLGTQTPSGSVDLSPASSMLLSEPKGGGGGLDTHSRDHHHHHRNQHQNQILTPTLPNMGPYLRLLTTSRAHLLSLLRKSSTTTTTTGSSHHSAPLSTIRDRWDGPGSGFIDEDDLDLDLDLDDDDPEKSKSSSPRIIHPSRRSKNKKYPGTLVVVQRGKTKKWRSFHGLSFEWVLGECLGAGLVELFETGSVGLGVRIV